MQEVGGRSTRESEPELDESSDGSVDVSAPLLAWQKGAQVVIQLGLEETLEGVEFLPVCEEGG